MIADFRENHGNAGPFGRGLVVLHTVGARYGSGPRRLAATVPCTDSVSEGW